NVTSYADATALNGTTYYYQVSALNAVGEGVRSSERTAVPATVPGAAALNSAAAGTNSVALAWSAPASNGGSALTSYKVYRGTASGGATLLTTLGNVARYTDSTALNGTNYYYQLTAVNAVGEGALSNERSATPSGVADPPTLATAGAGSGSVSLSWSA